jgi:hypothetical protein
MKESKEAESTFAERYSEYSDDSRQKESETGREQLLLSSTKECSKGMTEFKE